MCCLQYPHTVYDNRNLWIYSFCLLWLKGKPDCKLFHVLYLTWQNLISSNSFSLGITAVTFEHLTFDFLCDLVEQYTVFTKLISLCYPCFLAAQSQYIVWISLSILTYLFWFIIWLKVNQMYFIYIARIILQYFCSWSLLCVPSLTVWKYNFPQDSNFDTTLMLFNSVISSDVLMVRVKESPVPIIGVSGCRFRWLEVLGGT